MTLKEIKQRLAAHPLARAGPRLVTGAAAADPSGIAKLLPNNSPQNLVMRCQISRPVITYTDSMITRIMDRPKVSGTKRKW